MITMTNIKQRRANGIDWLIVQIDKEAYCIGLIPNTTKLYYCVGDYEYDDDSGKCVAAPFDIHVQIPEGNYEIIATLDEITEEQAEQVVECKSVATGGDDYYNYFRNYEGSQDESEWPWFNEIDGGAIKSVHSLIRSLFPDHKQHNYVILKSIKPNEQQ